MERLSRDDLTAHQRDNMIAAAIEVFAKRGYQGTTIDNIAVAAGSSVGGFYTLFEGKEDCFLRCYEKVVADLRAQTEAAIPESAEWPEKLSAAILALLRAVEEDPFAARIALVEARAAGPRALERFERTRSLLTEGLRGGRELSPIGDRLPLRLEDASVAGSAWLVHQRLVRGEAKGVTALLPEFLAILAGNYLGEDAARKLAKQSLAAVT